MAEVDHTSAYLAFNIFLHNVSENAEVSQVAFEFPAYAQLRCPTTGIPRGVPWFTDVSHTKPASKLRLINLIPALSVSVNDKSRKCAVLVVVSSMGFPTI